MEDNRTEKLWQREIIKSNLPPTYQKREPQEISARNQRRLAKKLKAKSQQVETKTDDNHT